MGVDVRHWYLYYRLMHALRHQNDLSITKARLELQDVLIDLRGRAQREWPEASQQDVQDFFEYLSHNPEIFPERNARHLTCMETWATEEVTNVG